LRPLTRLSAWAVFVTALPLLAQWPNYPTAGVPRDAKGKPDLNGPTPKSADGHPDLSGVWELARNAGGGGRGGGGGGQGAGAQGRGAQGGAAAGVAPGRGAGGPPPPPGPGGPPVPGPGGQPAPPQPPNGYATFFNVGAGLKDGLPLLPAAADLLKRRVAENSKDNPDAHCLPLGLMQLHMHPQPRKIIQNPGVTVILYEAQAGIRQVFTDGRPLPPADAQPWWYGYSTGKWDGDTFVVETTGFRDDVWLDVNGSPFTNKGKMTERFRRPNYGTLDIDITFEDPSMYSKPFTVKVKHRIMPDTDLIEFICGENERSDAHLVGK
jgi:hypothetical protein